MSTLLNMLLGLSGPVGKSFCNTFGIVDAALGASASFGRWDGCPSNRRQFADSALNAAATFVGCTSAFLTTGFAVRNVRATIWMKNYIRGVATLASGNIHQGMFFQLQVATGVSDFTAFAAGTGTSVIDARYAARATSTLILTGVVPNNENVAVARIAVFPTPNALTDTASFDCNIDAT